MNKALLDNDILFEIGKGIDPNVVRNATAYRNAFGRYTLLVISLGLCKTTAEIGYGLAATGSAQTLAISFTSAASMDRVDTTCWTVIQGAAAGKAADREEFARRYTPVIRAYLAARWKDSRYQQELEDGVQEVFLECFRQGGVLERADPVHAGGFRAFLYGVVRNVALRIEARLARQRRLEPPAGFDPENLAVDEPSLSQVFDWAWATSLLREAGRLQAEQAKDRGEEALRRVKLLRLRFQEGLPIRKIASQWQVEPATFHREYAKARQEFKAALLKVLAFH